MLFTSDVFYLKPLHLGLLPLTVSCYRKELLPNWLC